MSDSAVQAPLLVGLKWTDVSVHDVLAGYAVLGIPSGLLLGLALGLVARRADGWGGYGSFPRRAARLAHVAAVMIPALAGLYALLLPAGALASPAALWGARLWIAGGVTLPLALLVAAARPRWAPSVVPSALSLVAAAGAFAAAWFGGGS